MPLSHLSPPIFYLCIDCGGTKTAAVLAVPDGSIVARTRAGGSNLAYIGLDAFLSVVSTVAGAVLAEALSIPPIVLPINDGKDANGTPVPPFTLQTAWLGVSGVDSPSAVALLEPLVATLLGLPPPPSNRLVISNDTHLLAAPVRTLDDVRNAVTVIGGTGSIVVSFRDASAESQGGKVGGEPLVELARSGGWGWILGDEGGGFDIGRSAVRALCIQRDAESTGIPPQEGLGPERRLLRDRVLERFGIADILDILGAIHVPDPAASAEPMVEGKYEYMHDPREKRLSSLSPLVFQAAYEDGDPLAMRVVEECADKLAALVEMVLLPRDVNPTGSDRRIHAWSSVLCFGGSLVAIDSYRALVLAALAKCGHEFKHVEVINSPAEVGVKA
ncbi:hypothetical protein OF83DRAFT_35928, partial [Amylostereum chailletii]